MLSKLLHLFFCHITLVNETIYTFTNEAKRRMRSGWAIGPSLNITKSETEADTFDAHDDYGRHIYSINLKGMYHVAV